ncbi:MAG: FAD-dependent oxidoreductase [Desulfitobacteriaceae bacterium]|nr:FAD-dependent oxidoreductase [Desulfitobacteriaceae bacterium]MDD4346274.1 FAD-dependent oxidoreductase [Desulfitobacteriaceae bacterium]MDD4400603.1 FAD-dependent oxidoreductase [Desulfitobacteriaceae bacterium]
MLAEEQKGFNRPPQSYWIASTIQNVYPVLTEDLKVEVAIIGGGISGISCAYLLNTEGVKTAVIEADHILTGTTGHTTAKITSQHGLIYKKIKKQMSEEFARQYAEANESAIRLIKQIAKDKQIECDLSSQSAYIYTLQDKYVDKINEETKVASSLGIKAAFLEEIPLPFPIKAAVRFDHQAQFHPRKFLLPLANEYMNSGGKIFEQSRVVDIEKEGPYVIITNSGNKVTAEKLIIASHYPLYNKTGLYFTRIYAQRSYVAAVKAKENYPGGMYIAAEESGHSFRSQVSDEGELILVGGEQHKTGQGEDTRENYKALKTISEKTFTVEDIPYRWSTQDCMTLDGLPYVGHFTSETPHLYVATGYCKWGMTNSIAAAMILKDLIINGKSPWQDVYNPSRQTALSSAKNFIVENLNVTDELIAGKISRLPEQVEVKPGEGKIIKANGQRTGVYRDEQGTLHTVDTTCTHMGCELNWNSAEESWDCPCHGSRFSHVGEVIEGPALKPLNLQKDLNTIEKVIKDQF